MADDQIPCCMKESLGCNQPAECRVKIEPITYRITAQDITEAPKSWPAYCCDHGKQAVADTFAVIVC